MTSLPQVRCRYGQCKTYESTTPFITCQKCSLARYCSEKCLQNDFELHSLMCKADRVILNEDGSIIPIQNELQKMAIDIELQQQASKQQQLQEQLDKNTPTLNPTPNNDIPSTEPQQKAIYLGDEYDNEYVMHETINRLQIQTNLFYADQLEKLTKTLLKKKTSGVISKNGKNGNVKGKNDTTTKNNTKTSTPTKLTTKATNQQTKGNTTTNTTQSTTTTTSTTSSSTTTTTTTSTTDTSTPTSNNDTTTPTTTTTTTPQSTPLQSSKSQQPSKPQQQPNPKVMLFIQTENDINEFRWLIKNNTTPSSLQRTFICYFMSQDEFFQDVIPNHPHPVLKQPGFRSKLKSLFDTNNNPRENIITVGLFGFDQAFMNKSELPPYNDLLIQLQQMNVFGNADCLEINIDA